MTKMPSTVTSRDGTRIAYDRLGSGPVLLLVGGALSSRRGWTEPRLAQLLATSFTVVSYDRRGRGDSTDTPPYEPRREVEDIEALLSQFGGAGYLYGMSSGAALALLAASELGDRVGKLALYDAAYDPSGEGRRATKEYNEQLSRLLATGRKGDSVALFMRFAGVPEGQIGGMRSSPMWPSMEALAPSLAYDAAVLGDRSVPTELASKVRASALVLCGGANPPFFLDAARELSRAIPKAKLRVLEGQSHDVQPEALALVLAEFFSGAGRA